MESVRCANCQSHNPVRVPSEAGNGNAEVMLSFPDWKEGKVAPAAVDVPIADGGQKKK